MATQDKNQGSSKQNEFKMKELTKLQVFIGKWHAEGKSYADGQNKDNPYSSAVQWTSDESYEWLPGNFFVLHKWTAMAGQREFIGTEIIGYNELDKKFFTYFFDNAGFHPIYEAILEENIWSFTETNTNAKVAINDNNTITFNWEWRNDDSEWLPLCDRVAKRVE